MQLFINPEALTELMGLLLTGLCFIWAIFSVIANHYPPFFCVVCKISIHNLQFIGQHFYIASNPVVLTRKSERNYCNDNINCNNLTCKTITL